MKSTIKKKEIRSTVQNAMTDVLQFLKLETPSKRTKKILDRASRKFSDQIRRDLKKQFRRAEKKENGLNGKTSAKATLKSKVVEVN